MILTFKYHLARSFVDIVCKNYGVVNQETYFQCQECLKPNIDDILEHHTKLVDYRFLTQKVNSKWSCFFQSFHSLRISYNITCSFLLMCGFYFVTLPSGLLYRELKESIKLYINEQYFVLRTLFDFVLRTLYFVSKLMNSTL